MPTTSKGLHHWLINGGSSLESFSDRLNHVWTVALLLVLGGVISWKHGFTEPITCWSPAHFTIAQASYAQRKCWHKYSIYYVEKYSALPGGPPVRYIDEVTYYQWVPVILCLQALLFKLPNVMLQIFHGYSGISFDKIAGLTDGYKYLTFDERRRLANQIARYIHRWCRMFPKGLPWRILTLVWFVVKSLFGINVVIQLTYINKFLAVKSEPVSDLEIPSSYGQVIVDSIAKNNGSFWQTSHVFPQKMLCDFQVELFDDVMMYTIECNLNGNPFTEQAYRFLWVWLLFVAIVTSISSLIWTISTLLPFYRQRYIRRLLEVAEDSGNGTKAPVSQHEVTELTRLLGEDGVMVLKLIADNSSELLVKDIVRDMSELERSGAHYHTSRQTGQIVTA